MKQKSILAITLLMISNMVSAKIVLPPFFSDNMVLQQQSDAPIWGKAKPMKSVKVITSWNNKIYSAKADEEGHWKLDIQTPTAGGPYEIIVTDGEKKKLKNVMIGEVWICSGQSNMAMTLDGWGKINNYKQEIAEANHPNIRLLHVQQETSTLPETEIKVRNNSWEVCSPTTIPYFSATAYFFGRELAETQKVPVGLIHTSWGGTNVESWISGELLEEMPDFKETVARIRRLVKDNRTLKAEYQKALKDWNNRADEGFSEGKPARAATTLNDDSWETMHFPGKVDNRLAAFDGVVWLRKEVEIPSSWTNKELHLFLGTIDDNDVTYWNGKEIGKTNGPMEQRNYAIPAKLVKKGKNVLSVRIMDTGGNCSMNGNIRLCMGKKEAVSLSGDWKFQVAADTRKTGAIPIDRSSNPNQASVLYNAMIHPLIPYGIRGAIWYQGENNATRAHQYRELFPLIIANWRKDWKQNIPFYYVQLANFKQTKPQPSDSEWAELREAQMLALNVENTGMAVIIDKGNAKDIHPKDKQTVGHRLALIARAKTYGEKISYSGPLYRSYQIKDDKIILSFDHADGGLKSGDGKDLKGFAIAGRDHKFHWAKAEISGDKIIVSAPESVPYPIAVRYAWADNPVCNLYNGAGLPASPFRTDSWKGITQK